MGAPLGGALRNVQHERFCRAYVSGKSQADAYVSAGYSVKKKQNADCGAQRLMRMILVRRRINELQTYAAETENITVEKLVQEAARIQREAERSGNHSAAVAALTAKAKIAGLWVEKTETENVNLHYVVSDSLPSEEQWIAERTERDNSVTAISNHRALTQKP